MTVPHSRTYQEIRLAIAGACAAGLVSPFLIVPAFLIILILAVTW